MACLYNICCVSQCANKILYRMTLCLDHNILLRCHGSHEGARLSLFTLLNDFHCVDNMHLNFI